MRQIAAASSQKRVGQAQKQRPTWGHEGALTAGVKEGVPDNEWALGCDGGFNGEEESEDGIQS